MPEQQLRGLRARLEGRGLDPEGSEEGGTESSDGLEEETDLLTDLLEEHQGSDADERPRRGLGGWWRRRSKGRESRRAERDGSIAEESPTPDLLEELLESEGATPPVREEPREPGAEVVAAEESPGEGAQLSDRPEGNETQDAAEMQATSASRPDAAPESRRRRWFGRRREAGSDAESVPDLLEELLVEGGPRGEDAPPAAERVASGRRRGRHLARPHDGDDESPEGDDATAGPPVGRDSVLPVDGGRRAARQRRRTRIRRRVVAAGVLVAVGAAGVGVSRLLEDAEEPRPRSEAGAIAPAAFDQVTTTLVFGTRQHSDGSPDSVIWMSLLSLDGGGDEGAVVYIPAHTATEVPGRGLLGLGESFAAGGIPLLLVSTETLLGVPVDHYLELSQEEAATWFEATGEISVDVPGEVRVAAGPDQARVLLEPGLQRLSAEHLIQLLFTIGIDGDDAELGGRHLAFWQGFFEEFSDDPEGIAAAVRAAGPALSGTDFEGGELAEFLIGLVDQPPSSRTLANLPVEEVSVGGDQLYQVDQEQVDDFIADTMGGASGEAAEEVRVQILNGNGVPGIGQEVAQRLVGNGFRVILSGNARKLDNQKTRIVSYDASPEGLATAARAQDLLGVGEVQVSSQGQGIVDLTIVVGQDFPGKS